MKLFLLSILLLPGCSLLPAIPASLHMINYIKTGADAVSYVTTSKSTTDHVVSAATEKDCALHRLFNDNDVCKMNSKDSPP